MESVSKQQGFKDPDLDVGEPPPEFIYLIEWFADLHQARQSGMGGPSPISYSDILSWRELLRVDIKPYEVEIIRAIDNVYLNVANEITSKEMKRNKKK